MSLRQTTLSSEQRRELVNLAPDVLCQRQLLKLNRLLEQILPRNQFYNALLKDVDFPLASLGELSALPFTSKEQLVGEPPDSNFAANLTFPISDYSRFHRTSGTQGNPLIVLDTNEDWNWWIDTWQFVYDTAELVPEDRVFMAFSFGPFIGFWSAFDAAVARGALCIPSGGLTTLSRLEMLQSTAANVLLCTPSYALHLAETATEHDISVAEFAVNKIIVAGEPGGSIPEIKDRIESQWQAKVLDHSGASEVGPWGFSDPLGRGLYVNEAEFIAEFLSIEHNQLAGEGELSELVLTNLGRVGSPIIRYRTGDLVRPSWNDDQPSSFVLLQGGVLGRVDDMMIIRGVNVFPSSIEQILRSFSEILEYRMTVYKDGQMDQLFVEVEDRLDAPQRIIDEFQIRLGLRVTVKCVELGSLPRFDLKGKRFKDNR